MKPLIAVLCAAVASMETPKGAATGQASEGSTDARKAPQRPDSK